MTTTDNNQFRLTRRRALQGAAWSAPVIVVANAVPAFAVSPGSALDLLPGSSAAVQTTDGIDNYYDLQYAGLSIVVPTALSAGQLSLTVTYTPSSPGGPSQLFVLGQPAGWSQSSAPGSTVSALVMNYNSAVTAGSEIQMPNGIFVGSDLPTTQQAGTFVVTAQAPALTSDTATFATGPLGRGRSERAIPRPKV